MSGHEFLADRRELEFLLFEAPGARQAEHPYWNRARLEQVLDRALRFARKLGACYRDSDIEGCSVLTDGTVRIPRAYAALWDEYRNQWAALLQEQLEPGATQRELPVFMRQVLLELFMGAHPSFMTYGGFTEPARKLIFREGTPAQKALCLPHLKSLEWDACFCATEPQAGSDLSAIQSVATPVGEGVYTLVGEKKFISAGMHQLTANTLYIVLARAAGNGAQGRYPSCFIVPKYWVEADGSLSPNHVDCKRVEAKMGFRGCANTHLAFGESGPTRALALGDKLGMGLAQVRPLMQEARMYTGIFAVGIASSAYLHALRYARARVQGRPFSDSFNGAARRVAIIEHADVRRMLLEMKSKVEGCRALLARVGLHLSAYRDEQRAAEPDIKAMRRRQLLSEFHLPLLKAYGSDEAWRVCELSMQVHGGVGYLSDRPIEQYARDAKVLSIWEGANYLHAQELVREKLRLGSQSPVWSDLEGEIREFLRASESGDFSNEISVLGGALDAARETLSIASSLLRDGEDAALGHCCTRVLRMLAELVIGWLLLEAAVLARRQLAALTPEHPDRNFYRGKEATARFFVQNVLVGYVAHLDVIRKWKQSCTAMTSEMFGFEVGLPPP